MLVYETRPHVVSVCNQKGDKICIIRPGGAIVVTVDKTTNTYFVSDQHFPLIHKFNENGERLQSEGQIGKRPGQLLSSNGLDFHNGELYVTDCANHCIHVYDRDLNFLRDNLGEMEQQMTASKRQNT